MSSNPASRRRAWLLPSLLAIVAVLSVALPAFAHAPDPMMGGALFAQNQRVLFKWRAGSVPPPAIADAIRAAAADSNATRASKAATFALDAAGTSLIGYGPDATCGVNGIACFNRSGAPESFTMWLREHGRSFDWGVLRWCQMYEDPPNGCFDAETVALDEFGHVLILNHHANLADQSDYLDAVVQTVSHAKPKVGWDMHTYGRCDTATLQREYDVPTSATPISTCLDLDTVLTMKASATSVTYGSTVTMTSTLKIVDRSAYDRLGGNALSQRTVRLQRRSVGATTWSTMTTMSPGASAGTYTASIGIAATYEYRAVFSSPTNEGLTGDASPTVKVSMSGCGSSACPQSAPWSTR